MGHPLQKSTSTFIRGVEVKKRFLKNVAKTGEELEFSILENLLVKKQE